MTDWSSTKTRHGTASGFRLHQGLEERPCDACCRAKRIYDARRLKAPDKTLLARKRARAQGRAEVRLVAAHRDEYRAYYLEELEKD